jgi:hypothetical protein
MLLGIVWWGLIRILLSLVWREAIASLGCHGRSWADMSTAIPAPVCRWGRRWTFRTLWSTKVLGLWQFIKRTITIA